MVSVWSCFRKVLFTRPVHFLHRTVKDFLRTAYMQNLLHDWSADTFNDDLEICKAAIAMFKVTPKKREYFEFEGPTWGLVRMFLHHASPLDDDSLCEAVEVSLVDELESSLRAH